jgi:hypothetical protein
VIDWYPLQLFACSISPVFCGRSAARTSPRAVLRRLRWRATLGVDQDHANGRASAALIRKMLDLPQWRRSCLRKHGAMTQVSNRKHQGEVLATAKSALMDDYGLYFTNWQEYDEKEQSC